MFACRNWYKTPAVSPFILFCMMIKPRNSMLVSTTSLEAWRQRILHQWKTNHWLLPITACKVVHRWWELQHLHGRHGSKSYLSFRIQLLHIWCLHVMFRIPHFRVFLVAYLCGLELICLGWRQPLRVLQRGRFLLVVYFCDASCLQNVSDSKTWFKLLLLQGQYDYPYVFYLC